MMNSVISPVIPSRDALAVSLSATQHFYISVFELGSNTQILVLLGNFVTAGHSLLPDRGAYPRRPFDERFLPSVNLPYTFGQDELGSSTFR